MKKENEICKALEVKYLQSYAKYIKGRNNFELPKKEIKKKIINNNK